MTLLDNRINTTVLARRCVCDNEGYLDIISYLAQTDVNKKGGITPLINNLEMTEVFKDKDKEEEANIIDFIN